MLERDEIVALLFNVSDVNVTLLRIARLLRGVDDEPEEELSEERRAERAQALRNARRLRELAEKAQAELDRRQRERESA